MIQNSIMYSYTFIPRGEGITEVVFARSLADIMFKTPEIFHTHRFEGDKVATFGVPENKIEVTTHEKITPFYCGLVNFINSYRPRRCSRKGSAHRGPCS